jgi:hypothetical protein
MSQARLPIVVLSSVIRSAHQGESHGGVYLVDMASGQVEQVLDWNRAEIDWEGRGGDRGLRGIAFHGDRLFLAASDEILKPTAITSQSTASTKPRRQSSANTIPAAVATPLPPAKPWKTG